jgi:hypothetical protein
MPLRFATGTASAPPPSPGVPVAINYYDYQGNAGIGRHVGREAGADIVHFAWMQADVMVPGTTPPDSVPDRTVNYAAFSDSQGINLTGYGGVALDQFSQIYRRLGYADLALGNGNRAHIAYHTYPPDPALRGMWHAFLPTEGMAFHLDDELGGADSTCSEVLWPRIAVSTSGGTDIVHELALDNTGICASGFLWYWRYDGTAWQGPVAIDSTDALSYQVVADHNSDNCAILLNPIGGPSPRLYNVAYYESQTAGAGWISGAELGLTNKHFITNYTVTNGPQAWPDMSAAYDHDGNLHIVYLEQRSANYTSRVSIKHWDKNSGTIHAAATADWELWLGPIVAPLDFAWISLGIGDGSTACNNGSTTIRNYLYVTYSAFAGLTAAEYNDMSAGGYWNGELYLVASADGVNWSTPQNLTNTKTPNCNPSSGFPDSVCRSEVYASIGENVSDIDIFYVSDLDAGAAPQGEGTWQPNPMMYLRFPGGTLNAPYLCPPFQSHFAAALDTASGCGLYSQPGKTDTTALHLSNTGNTPLTGKITITYAGGDQCAEPWVSVNGRMDTLSFVIAPGVLDTAFQVVMQADTLPGQLPAHCTAVLKIAHNDPSQTSPQDVTIPFAISPCLCHADPWCDHATDVLDVIRTIGVAFRGEAAESDSPCAFERTDVDCSGASDVVDVVHMTSVAFRGQNAATEFCHPCQ